MFENTVIKEVLPEDMMADSNRYKDVYSKFVKVKSVAENSLERELSRINFEMDELKDSIDRLDPNVNINKYYRIPERKARIEELIIQKTKVYEDLKKIK